MAAEEQALSTTTVEAEVYHIAQDPRCRLCKDASETTQHKAAVTDVAISRDSNTKKKEHEKLEKYHGLKEEV